MPRLPDGQIQTAQNAFDAFITRENLHPEDHAALLRFLQHQVPMNLNTDEVRDPIPDQIQRIRQVYRTKREIQQMFGDSFVFTHLHQIGILLFGQRLTQLGVRESKTNLSLLEPFLARFLQRSTAIPPDVDLPTNPPQPQGKEVPRNKAASRAALERDGKRCLVTKAINPDVCHIIPYKLNSNPATEPDSRTIFGRIIPYILPVADAEEVFEQVFPTGEEGEHILAASDRLYNLLTLSTQVHRYWGNCYFAFKWVGVLNPDPNAEKQTVQLEFRWMPRGIALALGDEGLGKARPQHARKGDAFRPVKTDTMTPERMHEIIRDCMNSSSLTSTVQPQYQQPTGVYPTLVDHESHLPIKSGQIICVNGVDTEDVPKMKLAIDLQYVAIRLGGMSGAADAIESLDPRVPPSFCIQYDSDTGAISWEEEEYGQAEEPPATPAGGEPDQKKQG
ncbi:unnamed protein product [Clonostachys rosea f. rosea IK726]|uniref:Uncharacterized protein n=1 Tax=Clonostachys rosea f. rosea IK726 TaxID=1349383 RepID=A0ACA9TF59_BIOOC|nr:unnamed protein product [Clonostachys rosea f. rosea IK726]